MNSDITSMLSGLGVLSTFKNIPLYDRKILIKSCQDIRRFEVKLGSELQRKHNKLDLKVKKEILNLIDKSILKKHNKRITYSDFLTIFQLFYITVESFSKIDRFKHKEFCNFADKFLADFTSLFKDSQKLINIFLLKLEIKCAQLSNFNTIYYLKDHPKFSPLYPVMYLHKLNQEEKIICINKQQRNAIRLNYGFGSNIHSPIINGALLNVPQGYNFPVYISTHAIQRMKERLTELYDNSVVITTFQDLRIIPEKQMIQVHNGKIIFGYFVYELNYAPQMMLLTTFLAPLMSNTPESDKIYKKYGISNDEIRYFGLDSHEFMLDENVLKDEKIKNILDDSGVNIHNLAYKSSYNISDFKNHIERSKK